MFSLPNTKDTGRLGVEIVGTNLDILVGGQPGVQKQDPLSP